jgi:hypothetical protein
MCQRELPPDVIRRHFLSSSGRNHRLAPEPWGAADENLPDSGSDWRMQAAQGPHHQGFELASCGKEPGGTVTRVRKGDAPSGPERIAQAIFVTMRLRAERGSDQ